MAIMIVMIMLSVPILLAVTFVHVMMDSLVMVSHVLLNKAQNH